MTRHSHSQLRVVMQKAVQENLILHQKTAYLHAPIDQEIHMDLIYIKFRGL